MRKTFFHKSKTIYWSKGEKGEYEAVVDHLIGRKTGEQDTTMQKNGVFKFNTQVLVLCAFIGFHEDCFADGFEGTRGEIESSKFEEHRLAEYVFFVPILYNEKKLAKPFDFELFIESREEEAIKTFQGLAGGGLKILESDYKKWVTNPPFQWVKHLMDKYCEGNSIVKKSKDNSSIIDYPD